MSGILPSSRISPFVAQWLPRVAAELIRPGRAPRALDLAMGEGRHAIPLAQAGFLTFGVDLAVDRLITARRAIAGRGLPVRQWAADLDTYPLPAGYFDLLCCTRFLLRARWDDLKRCVRPGGFVMYETFTNGRPTRGLDASALRQARGRLEGFRGAAGPVPLSGSTRSPRPESAEGRGRVRRGPTSPDHLLLPGELQHAFADWTILHSEEVDEPAALARLVARKPGA